MYIYFWFETKEYLFKNGSSQDLEQKIILLKGKKGQIVHRSEVIDKERAADNQTQI